MTQRLFAQAPILANHEQAARAWQTWIDYGSLQRAESWRWTPLQALYQPQRSVEAADYQTSVPDEIEEYSEAGAMPLWLETADAPFAALNLALLEDTLRIDIPAGFNSDEVIAINLNQYRRSTQFSRIEVHCGHAANAAIWLDAGVDGAGAQCPLLYINAEAKAQCDVVLWLSGTQASAQLSYVVVEQQADTTIRVNSVVHGGGLARVDVTAHLRGARGHFAFGGIQCLANSEIGDYHINVRHHVESSSSQQIIRGALDDDAFGLFDGMIYVAHGAQQTDAKQDCRYILQSEQARSHSVPRLEIYADDVQCAHGATVGFLDPEALFYLQSRGIDQETGKKMLTLSFLHEAVVVVHKNVAQALHEAISALWLGDELAEEIIDPLAKETTNA